MERCTCDEAPDLENREAWQWGGCGDNLKYSSKFVKEFLGRRSSKDLRARVDFHNNLVGVKASWVGARGRGQGAGQGGVQWGGKVCGGQAAGCREHCGAGVPLLQGGGASRVLSLPACEVPNLPDRWGSYLSRRVPRRPVQKCGGGAVRRSPSCWTRRLGDWTLPARAKGQEVWSPGP